MFGKALLAATMIGATPIALAQGFPIWERLLAHYSGKTDETPVPSMKTGHMQMSLKGDPKPGDSARAAQILAAAGGVLSRYRDVKTAMHDGYKPFFPTGRVGKEIHYRTTAIGVRSSSRSTTADPVRFSTNEPQTDSRRLA